MDLTASTARADHPEAGRELQEAANPIRESKLEEKLQYSEGTIRDRDPESAGTLEMNIESDLRELREQLEAMDRLEREGIWNHPAEVAGLNEEILEMLKRLEFGLRREVEGERERRATLTGSDEVPPGYRELVEEYYKALARGSGGG